MGQCTRRSAPDPFSPSSPPPPPQAIGCRSQAGRHTPGIFTNPSQKSHEEPRLIIVTDPLIDHQVPGESKEGGRSVHPPIHCFPFALPCRSLPVQRGVLCGRQCLTLPALPPPAARQGGVLCGHTDDRPVRHGQPCGVSGGWQGPGEGAGRAGKGPGGGLGGTGEPKSPILVAPAS